MRKMTIERAIKIINKNNMLDGSDFSEALEIVLDTIEALQAENEQLRAQVARMREALESIKRLDKTEYTYYGAQARNKNGELPPDGERWKTPMEIAMGVLSTDIDQDYHNPADVEALRAEDVIEQKEPCDFCKYIYTIEATSYTYTEPIASLSGLSEINYCPKCGRPLSEEAPL